MTISKETLKALREFASSVTGKSKNGLTTEEITEAMGCCRATALKRMKLMAKTGALRLAGQRSVDALDGRKVRVPVYEVKGWLSA